MSMSRSKTRHQADIRHVPCPPVRLGLKFACHSWLGHIRGSLDKILKHALLSCVNNDKSYKAQGGTDKK